MPTGKLIVIEGLDSSGKETQSRLLETRLRQAGANVRRVEFPNYESPSSALVKMYLSGAFGDSAGSVNAYAASSFYAADRFATYKTGLEAFYLAGGVIVADRYTTSNMIHQGSKIADPAEKEQFLSWVTDYEYRLLGLPRPDCVIFLDMPVEVSLRLMEQRKNKADGTETKDIHESDRQYLFDTYAAAKDTAAKCGWLQVQCSKSGAPRSIEDVQQDVYAAVQAFIPDRSGAKRA